MLRLFVMLLVCMLPAAPTLHADFTMVVPQRPGGGTSLWAQIVAKELEKTLNEKITLQHIPGARDIPGFNKFENELKQDDHVIMVSHGGNGISFLQEQVDYDYRRYDSIGMMNLTIVLARRNNVDKIAFASGSGMIPDGIAIALYLCGPNKTLQEYKTCFGNNVNWVHGMNSGERRLAFLRGELNATRENPAAFKTHVQPVVDAGDAAVWFTHGLLDIGSGKHVDDPNYPGLQFEKVFLEKWGVPPTGELYSAYKLVKSYRDSLQKALWVRRGNPHTERLREALRRMVADAASRKTIEEKVGRYEWVIGEDGNRIVELLTTMTTREALTVLVDWNQSVFGLESVFKPELVR